MNVDTFGSGDELVWVMGWGNRADSRHERWFIDKLADEGYRVHAIELPTNDPDFEGEYVAPVREYLEDVGEGPVLAHSMGGLTTAHVQPDRPVVYLSPWWGMQPVPSVARLLFKIPTAVRFIPMGFDPKALGELAEEQDKTAPDRISPAWIRAMRDAQGRLPPIDEADVVFYSERDQIVDPGAIVDHVDSDQLREYDGGHELFSSADREEYVERVITELEDGK